MGALHLTMKLMTIGQLRKKLKEQQWHVQAFSSSENGRHYYATNQLTADKFDGTLGDFKRKAYEALGLECDD